MRLDQPFGIAGASLVLPDQTYDLRTLDLSPVDLEAIAWEGYQTVPVGHGLPVEEFALPAARQALAEAECRPAQLDLILYACVADQGPGVSSAAHRLGRLLGADRAVAFGVQQMSNGSAAAVATALSLMAAEPSYRHALVAAADVFDSDPAQRWEQHGPRGILPGDGGAAVVIQRTASTQVVRSVATSGRPAIELQFFTGFAPGGSAAPDARRLHPAAVPIMRECVTDGVTQALTESDLDGGDPRIRVVMITRLGRTLLRRVFLPALPEGLPEPLFLSAATGHLGAADQLANLTYLREAKLLAPGEFAVLVSVGMGFTATCMIIEEIGWRG